MYKQFKQGSKHLSLWHSHLRFLHQEQSLRPISTAFFRGQHSSVRMKSHFPWVNVR